MCIYDDGNSVFRAKKSTICNAKFWDLGIMGRGGQNMSSKVLYFDLPIHFATYMELH